MPDKKAAPGWQSFVGKELQPGDEVALLNPWTGDVLLRFTFEGVDPDDGVLLPATANPCACVLDDVLQRWPQAAKESVQRRARANDRRPVAL